MKRMQSRFAGTCAECGGRIRRGESIIYDRLNREAYHEACGLNDYEKAQEEAWISDYCDIDGRMGA